MKIGHLITLKTPNDGEEAIKVKTYFIGHGGNVHFTPVNDEDLSRLLTYGYEQNGYKSILIHYTNKDLIIKIESIFLT
jgi:hypothetical protein